MTTPAPSPTAPSLTCHGATVPDGLTGLNNWHRRKLDQGVYQKELIETAIDLIEPGQRVAEINGDIGLVSTVLALRLGLRHHLTLAPLDGQVDAIGQMFAANGVFRPEIKLGELVPDDPDRVSPALDLLAAFGPDVVICSLRDGAEPAVLATFDFTTVQGAVFAFNPRHTSQDALVPLREAMDRDGLESVDANAGDEIIVFRRPV